MTDYGQASTVNQSISSEHTSIHAPRFSCIEISLPDPISEKALEGVRVVVDGKEIPAADIVITNGKLVVKGH